MSSSPSPESAKHLEEIMKDRYDREFQRKETLDSKANNMMTIASTVATLYTGFGVAIVTQLFKVALQISAPVIILIIGTCILITSILLGTRGYMLREYVYAFNFIPFVKEMDKKFNIKMDNEKIQVYENKDPKAFSNLMSKIYTKCIMKNMSVNEARGTYIIWSQRIFLAGLVSFPVFIISVILYS